MSMKPIIDLIWTIDTEIVNSPPAANVNSTHCGGGTGGGGGGSSGGGGGSPPSATRNNDPTNPTKK